MDVARIENNYMIPTQGHIKNKYSVYTVNMMEKLQRNDDYTQNIYRKQTKTKKMYLAQFQLLHD